MTEPYHFYTGEEASYQCPNGHTIESSRSEDVPWLRVFRGHCSNCEEEWITFVDDHSDNWDAILDDNFPEYPTYFEWKAQRILDRNRRTNVSRGDRAPDDRETPPELPRKDDFAPLVPWVATDAPSALSGPRVGCDHAQSDNVGNGPFDRSDGEAGPP